MRMFWSKFGISQTWPIPLPVLDLLQIMSSIAYAHDFGAVLFLNASALDF